MFLHIISAPKYIHCGGEHQTYYRGCTTVKPLESIRNKTTNQKDTVNHVNQENLGKSRENCKKAKLMEADILMPKRQDMKYNR